jgi:hypothetical protein
MLDLMSFFFGLMALDVKQVTLNSYMSLFQNRLISRSVSLDNQLSSFPGLLPDSRGATEYAQSPFAISIDD